MLNQIAAPLACLENFFNRFFSALKLIKIAAVNHKIGVNISVSCMAKINIYEIVVLCDLNNLSDNIRHPAAGNSNILIYFVGV